MIPPLGVRAQQQPPLPKMTAAEVALWSRVYLMSLEGLFQSLRESDRSWVFVDTSAKTIRGYAAEEADAAVALLRERV